MNQRSICEPPEQHPCASIVRIGSERARYVLTTLYSLTVSEEVRKSFVYVVIKLGLNTGSRRPCITPQFFAKLNHL